MKKKAIIAIASLLAFGQGAWAWDGSGTVDAPYLIKTIDDLNQLATNVNSGNAYAGKYFKLTAENGLDYTDKTFTPIGYGDITDGKPFSGTFDGNGKTISGITVNTSAAWGVGLFGYISKATIKNLTITNSSFTANGFVGAIAGGSDTVDEYASPTIDNCHVASSVSVTAKDFGAGGIIGINQDNLTIKDCTCAATVTSTDVGVGGIIGVAYEDSYMVTITDSYYLGNMPAIGVNGGVSHHATINITLLNNDTEATVKNTSRISKYNGETANVTLSGRTLYKDGNWNTLCLPFDVTVGSGQMTGATAMTLTTSDFVPSTGVLTLNFTGVTSSNTITAGTPFIVNWTGSDVSNPVFCDVTITNTSETPKVTDNVDFVGSFSPVSLVANDKEKLYLGDANTLYYPNATMTIGAFRAYFRLHDIDSGGGGARTFVLNFGDDDATETAGIDNLRFNSDNGGSQIENRESVNCQYFDLSGRKIENRKDVNRQLPKGVYIVNGKKVVIK